MEDEDDPFAAIIRFCLPTASQRAKFRTCPFDRESEDFPDPDPFPCPAPGTHNSADQQSEGNAALRARPEHQHQSNPHYSYSHVARTVDLGGSKKVKGDSKQKARVPGKGVGEIRVEGSVNEVRETEPVVNEIIDLCSDDSDEEAVAVGSQYPAKRVTFNVGVAGGVGTSAGLKNQHKEHMRNMAVDRNYVSSDVSESPEEETVGNKMGNPAESRGAACSRRIEELRFSGRDDDAGRIPMPSKRKRELPASMRGMEKNDGRGSVVGATAKGKEKITEGSNGVVGKADTRSGQLNRGKGKVTETMNGESNDGGTGTKSCQSDDGKEKKRGLLDMLGVLKAVIRNLDNDAGGRKNDDPVDFLETAKKRGITFPRPRWWPPEGEEW